MNGTVNTVDLSHAGVDNILAALANAGLEVHYNETDGDTFIDVWLTDTGAEAPIVLSWRDNEGWRLKAWDTNDTAEKPSQAWAIIGVAGPADLAPEVASILAKYEPLPDPLDFALAKVLEVVNGVDPIERDAEYEDCSAEELHIHKQLGRIRALISQIRTEVAR